MGRCWGLVAGTCAMLILSAAPSFAPGRNADVRPDLGGVRSDYYEPLFYRSPPRPERSFRANPYRYRAFDRPRWRVNRNEMRRAMREYQRELREARRELRRGIREAWRGRRW